MFWRGDPNTGSAAPSNPAWPRNGAILKGLGPYEIKGEQWMKVIEYQQAGTTGFVPVPEGTYMVYDQGGLLLHNV